MKSFPVVALPAFALAVFAAAVMLAPAAVAQLEVKLGLKDPGLPPAAIPVRESQSGRFGQPVG